MVSIYRGCGAFSNMHEPEIIRGVDEGSRTLGFVSYIPGIHDISRPGTGTARSRVRNLPCTILAYCRVTSIVVVECNGNLIFC